MLEPLPSENCKGLNMKFEVKYLLSTSFSGAKFFIHQLSESLKMRKIFSTSYRDAKESTNPGRKFSEILRTFIELSGLLPNLYPAHRNISYGYANLEIVYFMRLDISICCMS